MDAQRIIEQLNLKPLPLEGGYFRETYRSEERIDAAALPPRYAGERSRCTAIYYLLTPDCFSALHRVKSDEIFHFYAGDPVRMLQLHPEGRGETLTLGGDLDAGHRPQVIVSRGVWQGCRLAPGGRVALMGTTVAPGFDYDDFELASRPSLFKQFPRFENEIRQLTRES